MNEFLQALALVDPNILTLLSTLFAAISATAALAAVQQTRKERIEGQQPLVKGYFDIRPNGALVFILSNEGAGSAFNLAVQFEPSPVITYGQRKPLGEISLFRTPISIFPAGYKHEQIVGTGHQYLNDNDQPKQILVRLKYTDGRGKEHLHSLAQDLSLWSEATLSQNTVQEHLYQIRNELKTIAKNTSPR